MNRVLELVRHLRISKLLKRMVTPLKIASSNKSRLRFPINVHGWGGLGSQVFLVITAKRISERFPDRKVRVIFHTSGVTRRQNEVSNSLWLDHLTVDDFSKQPFSISSNKGKNLFQDAKVKLSKQLKKLFIFVGFIAELNSENEIQDIRRWLVSVRGHYGGIVLTEDELELAYDILVGDVPKIESTFDYVAVHFRLGDLLNITSKSHVDPSLVANIIKVHFSTHFDVRVFSDTSKEDMPNDVTDILNQFKPNYFSHPADYTIRACIDSEVFIGTNSKLSLWTALFRLHEYPTRISYLPEGLHKTLSKLWPASTDLGSIKPY